MLLRKYPSLIRSIPWRRAGVNIPYEVFTSAAYLTSLECFHKVNLSDRALSLLAPSNLKTVGIVKPRERMCC